MIFRSREVHELYERYHWQVMKILQKNELGLTQEECRILWDQFWKEAMDKRKELRCLKTEEEKASWLLAIVKRNLEFCNTNVSQYETNKKIHFFKVEC